MSIPILDRTYTIPTRPQDTNIDWLNGNIGVWQKLTLKGKYGVTIRFSSTSTLFMDEPNVFTLTDGSNWREKGFEVGDFFKVQWNVTEISTGNVSTYRVFGTIVSILGNQMESNNTTLGNGALQSNIYPTQFGDNKIHSVFIATTKKPPVFVNGTWVEQPTAALPEGIDFTYFHLRNSQIDSLNPNSFIDGSQTRFSLENTHLMTIGQVLDFVFEENQSGMSVDSCKLIYRGPNGQYSHIYDVEIVFMISNFGIISDIEENIPPDNALDAECITDNFFLKAFPEYNNPNVFIENDPNATKRLGNTGWFDENYNGKPNDFTIASVVYSNLGATIVNQLDYQNTIKVRAVIDGVLNVSGLTKCCFGFQWETTEDETYKSKTTPYHENTKISTGGTAFGDVFTVSNIIDPTLRQGYSNDGASMDVQNIRFQNTATDQITFEAEFVPNAAFATFMDALDETERGYSIWVSVANQNETANHANRVSLKLDTNTMITFIEPIGPWANMNIGYITHPYDESATPSVCGDDIRIEDDLLAKVTFTVDTAIDPTIPIPTGITYGILIERDADEFQYQLDRKSIDLSIYSGPEQYNFEASRNFKLGAGNSKNFIKAIYEPSLNTGTERGVLGNYGFKVRWEDWLARNSVPLEIRNAFQDNALKSDGLSNDWFRYSLVAGWSMYFFVFVDAQLDGVAVRYENLKQLVFKDYNQNANITTVVTYLRESDSSPLSAGVDPESGLPLGVILSNELVRVIFEYTRLSGTWGSLANVYGLNTIEEREGAGQIEYRQLSSVWLPEIDNPLLPIPSDTLLTVTLVSPTVITCECLIDPSRLDLKPRYKLTGRLGCK